MEGIIDASSLMTLLCVGIFLLENIILTYTFLKPRRGIIFQAVVFVLTWLILLSVRFIVVPVLPDSLLRTYILGSTFLVPVVVIFKDSFQAKLFVFYMIFSLSQFTLLIFSYADRFLKPPMSGTYVLIGLLIELAALPLIRRYLRNPVRDILTMIGRRNPWFTIFPFITFLMLVNIALKRDYSVSSFISLILYTLIIFFSYYLVSVAIKESRRRAELDILSRTDPLTGIYNRRHLEQKIQNEWERSRRTGSVFSILIADVDFFKSINDRFGHDRGDFVLKTIASDISRSVRAYDTVGRWGGEEFIILLPDADDLSAGETAERIRKTVGSRVYEDADLNVTLTIGSAVSSEKDTCANIIKKADSALYYGKRKGRNCVVSYEKINK